MLKLLYAVPPLLCLALLPQGVAAPSVQAALSAQIALSAQAAPPDQAEAPGQAAAPGAPIPATNPITPTADSQAHAKDVYKMDCAMCHGANGDGKGDVVASMKLDMKDLRDPATLQGKSDAEIFKLIRNGKGKMPSEGDRAKPEEIWNLVALVRSFSSK